MKAPKDDELQQRIGLVLLLVALWTLAAAWVTVLIWPIRPSGTMGWLLLILLAPPLFFGFEIVMELLFSPTPSDQVTRKRFSTVKAGIGILLYVLALVTIAWFKFTWGR